MASSINVAIPEDNVDVAKAPLRQNWTHARNELNHGGFATHSPDNYTADNDTVNAHIAGIDAALAPDDVLGVVPADHRTFTNTVVSDVPEVTYSPVSGGRAITKGTSTWNGSVHWLPFTGDGSAITFGSGFVDHEFNAISSALIADGAKGIICFAYFESLDVVVVITSMPAVVE